MDEDTCSSFQSLGLNNILNLLGLYPLRDLIDFYVSLLPPILDHDNDG